MKHRRQYLSCTSFANRIRGTAKPYALTFDEWEEWHANAKLTHPIRYWIAEEFLDGCQDVVRFPFDVAHNICYYIRNRFFTRTHCLYSPSLIKGQWCDLDRRIAECTFAAFVDFIEVEKAWMYCRWSREDIQKYEVPWYRRWGFATWRSPQAGTDYLLWEIGIVKEEPLYDPSIAEFGQPTDQAIHAKEQLAIYRWIKDVRNKRPKDDFENEERYHAEDTEYLTRLINIRQSLWT